MKIRLKDLGRRGRTKALTLVRLNELTQEDWGQLNAFAERRLARLPRNNSTAEDMVQSALQAIMRGTSKKAGGRRPRLGQIQTKAGFLRYLGSAINSVIDATQRKRELFYIHEAIQPCSHYSEENETPLVLIAKVEPDVDASWVDLKKELFKRLRRQSPPHLLPTIDEWENVFFWSSQVPLRGAQGYPRQVRALAMRVLKDIAEGFRG